MKSMSHQMVVIIDFGGQNNQLVARRVRDFGVYCEVKSYTAKLEEIKAMNPVGLIFTGSANSSNADKIANMDAGIFEMSVPMLDVNCGCKNVNKDIHTVLNENDLDTFKNFLFDICGCTGDWTMADFAKQNIAEIREKVGDGKVLLALSGGVDSSVLAALLSKAIGNQLTCIFVDHGCMRKNEGDEVEEAFKGWGLNFNRVNAQDRFMAKLAGVTEPEKKRKIIGEEFIRVFEEEAKKIGTVDFLAQGTIYPDIIESGIGDGAVIKSHHNVGGLPDYVDFKDIVEPLRLLFKDEVRALGLELGLSDVLVYRQPFPGPGLAVRCIGELTTPKLDILRDADLIFRQEIANAGLDKSINQYFAVITDMRSVGVKNDVRTYDYTLALRAVNTTDFMTADFAKIPYEVLEKTASRIVNEVKNINRIVYDITTKPPATIEWE